VRELPYWCKVARFLTNAAQVAMRTDHVPNRLEVSAHLVDARGRPCPVPIIELAKALRRFELVELWADDPAALGDLATFCEATGHQCERVDSAGEQALIRALIRGSRPPRSAESTSR
jgi:tRNA 2-thiouridine synthesizing protein A